MTEWVTPAAPARTAASRPTTFSVIIAAYQAAGTVLEAVRSALDQSEAPLEVIVVDDGSTDATEDALAPVRDRIVYIRQRNSGVSAARNRAAREAQGEFVSLLDADDVYERSRLAELSRLAAARPDLDILMTDLRFEIDGRTLGRFASATPFAEHNQEIEILRRCFVAEPAVRRSALLAVGGFDEDLRIAEDWDCWIRLIHAGARVGLVNRPLTRYRIGVGSLTGDRAAALRARVSVLDRARRLNLSPEQRRALDQERRTAQRRALKAELDAALRGRLDHPRRRGIALAATRGASPRQRAWALTATLAPGRMARGTLATGPDERVKGHARAAPDADSRPRDGGGW